MENLEMEIITVVKVADKDRVNFWLRHVGMKMLAFERHVYCWMRRLCPHYDGGYWKFYDLSNGGFYIAPADEKRMWLTWPGNYFDDEMSADAAGMVATLYALNDFAQQVNPVFWRKVSAALRLYRIAPGSSGDLRGHRLNKSPLSAATGRGHEGNS